MIPQREYFDKSIANSDNTDGYYIIEQGDFVYNPRKSSDAPYGPVSIYKYPESGIVSPLYLCFRALKPINSSFYDYFFKSPSWHRYIYLSGDSGARHDRVSIKDDVFFSMPVYIPSEEEQLKVSSFLSLIEKRIADQQQLVEHLKKYKRGLHKRVFSPKPHWSVKPLRDIATFCGGGTPSKDVSKYWQGSIGWISSSDVQEDWIDEISISRRITEEAIANSATKLCPKGTIAIISRVGVGKVAIMPEDLCTSQDYTNITTIDGDITFFAYQIAHKMKIEASKTQGTAIKGVTADTIKSMEMDIPNLDEQRKIATTLQKFDHRIKHEIQLLNFLQKTKRSLLQQLFM